MNEGHSVIDDQPSMDAIAPTPELIIILEDGGPVLPAAHGVAAIRLGWPELHWLHRRVGGDPCAPEPPRPPADMVHQLEHYCAELAGLRVRGTIEGTMSVAARRELGDVPLRIATPVALLLTRAGFDFVDHDGGVRARLDARQLASLAVFTDDARTLADAFAEQQARGGSLDRGAFAQLVSALASAGMLCTDDESIRAAEGRAKRELRRGLSEVLERGRDVERWLAERRRAEDANARRTGRTRIQVVPVNNEGHPILSLGLVMAYAEAYQGGRLTETYDFVPDWADRTVPSLPNGAPPAIYLFSNYIWSHAWNIVRAGEVKAKSPFSLTVHGGPNTPKYDDDVRTFFRANPQVDIAVHGEGEIALAEMLDALRGHFGDGPADLSVLRDVPGLTFRLGDEIVRTPRRERISDVNAMPSPYRTGLFDSIGLSDTEIVLMTIETNRGCPYGCTFCDWGSATLSRIRQFDLDRVYAELEWCARHKVRILFLADANFGIFARDVDIARKIVELKQRYGYPKSLESSYAKNTVKHLREIIEILAAGGVLSTGALSLQSLDPDTLRAIRRSNIRLGQYEALAAEFTANGLPFVVELMMGLPGSTMASYLADLQHAVDREVRARVNPTEVLMNSPMNDPAYRAEHQVEVLRPVSHDWSEDIGTRQKSLVVSTATFTRAEYALMEAYRRIFLLAENFGVLRQVSRFVRQETGVAEIDFYVRLAADAARRDSGYPMIRFVFETITEYMIPPVSWAFFIAELRTYLVRELGIADDRALDTVMRVQHALIPARERAYPLQLALPHDFAAWHQAMLRVKRDGGAHDWANRVPRLHEFGPATFVIDDPQSVSRLGLGMSVSYDVDSDWELRSPVGRPIRYRLNIHL
jgi:radical SAM superfamily enzyme YgiQ (UPF0313 family)